MHHCIFIQRFGRTHSFRIQKYVIKYMYTSINPDIIISFNIQNLESDKPLPDSTPISIKRQSIGIQIDSIQRCPFASFPLHWDPISLIQAACFVYLLNETVSSSLIKQKNFEKESANFDGLWLTIVLFDGIAFRILERSVFVFLVSHRCFSRIVTQI